MKYAFKKYRFRIILGSLILLLSISVYFNITNAAGTDTPEPGSDQDPLVTKGYVDTNIDKQGKLLQQLQAQLDSLKSEKDQMSQKLNDQDQLLKSLQNELKTLKANGTGTSTGTSTGNTGSSNTGSNGSSGSGTASIGTGTVNASALNVRAAANTSSAVAAKLIKGEKVTLISKSGDWYKIKTSKGVQGWVMGSYITK